MFDASFDVKWISSLLRDDVFLGLEMYARMEDPTSRSLWYICAESMLRRVSHMAFLYAIIATITLGNQPEYVISSGSFFE